MDLLPWTRVIISQTRHEYFHSFQSIDSCQTKKSIISDGSMMSRSGAKPKGGGANLYFWQFFAEKSMKMNEFEPGACVPGIPLGSATDNGTINLQL